jgi:hypothetical protein
MVDEAVLAARIAAIEDAIRRVREVLPASAEGLRDDRTAREVVILNVFVALRECLAPATHWLAAPHHRPSCVVVTGPMPMICTITSSSFAPS